jgi:AcrR family transcriptional regulator
VATAETLEGGRLRRSQDARRARVIAAVLDLLREGGYDAFRVRAVWERTGVGTDTIYRYFGSRDGLIQAAVNAWLAREFFEPSPAWLEGATPAERLLAMCRHTWDVWERNSQMLDPFVRAAIASGSGESGLAAVSRRELVPLSAAALADVDPQYRDDVLLIVDSVTHSVMTSIVRGQLAVTDAYPILERTVRRLAQHPAMDGHRPDEMSYRAPDPVID